MFMIAAPQKGTGKTTLAKALGQVASGSFPPVGVWPSDSRSRDDELRKRFATDLLSGRSLVILDNLPSGESINSPVVDNVLTSEDFFDRALHRNKNIVGKHRFMLVLTGNSISASSDTADRVVNIRLESSESDLRTRPLSTFHEIGDFPNWLSKPENRKGILESLLTIQKAWVLDGSGHSVNNPVTNGYYDFEKLAVDPVRWVTGLDPLGDRAIVKTDDDEANNLGALIANWLEMVKSQTPNDDLSEWRPVRELMDIAEKQKPGNGQHFLDSIDGLGGDPENAVMVSKTISRFVDRTIQMDNETIVKIQKKLHGHKKIAMFRIHFPEHDTPAE